MERHRAAVAKIAAAVRGYFDKSEPYRIFHGSTNSTRPARGPKTRVVDISALSNVISVDTARRIAFVEPNVPMDALVTRTLQDGLVPPVVMEFPGITAGGGFAGTAGESSSFRHGFFDDTVRSVEMVLPDGEVVTATPDGERADLFRGAAGAVGTLGVTTLLELRLMDAKKFVRTRYRRTSSVAEAVQAVKEEIANPDNDYVDGILFSKDHGVVITGALTDEKPADAKVQTFSGPWDPWFYLHVKERTEHLPSSSSSSGVSAAAPSAAAAKEASAVPATAPAEDYVPLAEYLFRYDRGGFWVGAAAFRYFWWVPFSKLTRWFLNDFLHTRMMYRALHGSGESARFVVQDLAMPFATTEQFVDYTSRELGIWPLWLCPLKRRGPPTFHPFTTTPPSQRSAGQPAAAAADGEEAVQEQQEEEQTMLNVGVWGWGPRDAKEFVAKNRELEAKVRELGGMKWLYAHTYYQPDEFWSMYGGRAWYDALRTKYRATTLPSVWDKVYVDPEGAEGKKRHWLKRQAPIGGLWGIYKSIKSRDYKLHRKAGWKWKGEQ